MVESESFGAQCHTGGKQQVSAILTAMGVPMEFALGTLRLSVGRHTTLEEVERAIGQQTRDARAAELSRAFREQAYAIT